MGTSDVLSISYHDRSRYFLEIIQPIHITGHVTGWYRISYEDSFSNFCTCISFTQYANSFGFCPDDLDMLVLSQSISFVMGSWIIAFMIS